MLRKTKLSNNVSKIDILKMEYFKAIHEYNQALSNFDNAESDFVASAVLELEAKRKKIDALKKQIEKEGGKIYA